MASQRSFTAAAGRAADGARILIYPRHPRHPRFLFAVALALGVLATPIGAQPTFRTSTTLVEFTPVALDDAGGAGRPVETEH
jgi:hypothetical protein